MICGGGLEQELTSPTEDTCGRIKPLDEDPNWTMTRMPQPRVMVEGINLLDGSILWLNGAQLGAQGFGIADQPAYDFLVYHPGNDSWQTVAASTIPRLYHSIAVMLKDGRILISGSNPNEMPVWPDEIRPDETEAFWKYPTELQNEIYTPQYLQGGAMDRRPQNVQISKTAELMPGDDFEITFSIPANVRPNEIKVSLYQGGFVTHSLHMGQVLYFLESTWKEDDGNFRIETKLPKIRMAPGPYFVYVMADGVPSLGEAIMVKPN
jgi:hypothetical protein